MYARHFALNKDAFSIAPDPRFLFMSERHREALAHLLFGVTGAGGFVLLTGNIGTGKTTVCRCFLEQIPAGCNVALVFNPKLSVMELLQTICEEFHVSVQGADHRSVKTYVDAINVYLLQSHASGQSNVLIIDEAQNLPPRVLEQLRLLTNLETHERKLLQIVLIGQPELRTMLERPELEQLAQRVIARYHLEALNEAEAEQYIRHRMAVAGHSGPLPFDERALHRIYALTGGIPRRINLLCGRTLLGAWSKGLRMVNRTMVGQAAAEVFGDDPAYRSAAAHSHAALVLGIVGVLCLLGAMALQVWHLPIYREATLALQEPVALPALPAALASQPVAPASAPESAQLPEPLPAPEPLPVEDVQALLPQLPRDMALAWHELAAVWSLQTAGGDPCLLAKRAQLECYRGNELSVPLLRQLDRPGVLTLQKGAEPPVYATLIGLNEQAATLRLGGQPRRVTLISLARFWRGDYATYWRPPTGYGAGLRDTEVSTAYALLANQLAQLEGKPERLVAAAALPLDALLVARVKAFQKGQGIKADGHPGPMTWMQIDQALGLAGPSLEAGAR